MQGSLAATLRHDAQLDPARELVRFVGGPSLSAGALWDAACRTAAYLAAHGVGRGDRVAVMMRNRQELLWAPFGANAAGAASVLLGTDLKGAILTHMLTQSRPKLVLAEQQFAEVLESALAGTDLRPRIVTFAGDVNELISDIEACEPAVMVQGDLRDLATILYTSGTTGRSKGVMLSNGACFGFAEAVERSLSLTSDDITYSCLPLYHNNALSVTLIPAIRTMSTAVFGPRFSASQFWAEVRDCSATVISLLGSMVPILWNRPGSESDRSHQVRIAMTVPAPTAIFHEFQRRFGFRLASLYGMTDLGLPILTPPGEARRAAPECSKTTGSAGSSMRTTSSCRQGSPGNCSPARGARTSCRSATTAIPRRRFRPGATCGSIQATS
jgi:crotonobetaine/carnitine-CoA ligase